MKQNVHKVLLFVLFLLVSVGCKSNPTEPIPGNLYKIVFDLEDSSGYRNIYIMNEDGSNQMKLTNSTLGWCSYPVLSPDMTKIAFTSYSIGNVEIFIMNIDGSDIKQLTNFFEPNQSGYVYAWSPDGMKIAYSSYDGIYLINSDGTDERRLTNNIGELGDRNPSWSPDGNKLAFYSFERRDSLGFNIRRIYVINIDGSDLIPLTNDLINARDPLWLPNGKTLAFKKTKQSGFNDIYLINIDGSGLRQITPSDLEVTYMSISPDGNKIAFCHYVSLYVIDLYIMNIDGSELQKINPPGVNMDGLGYVNWSPDGKRLTFSPGYSASGQGITEYGIYIINSDGSNMQYLGEGNNPQLLSVSSSGNYY